MIFESIDCEWYAGLLGIEGRESCLRESIHNKEGRRLNNKSANFQWQKKDNNDDKDNGKDIEKYINKENS